MRAAKRVACHLRAFDFLSEVPATTFGSTIEAMLVESLSEVLENSDEKQGRH